MKTQMTPEGQGETDTGVQFEPLEVGVGEPRYLW